METGPFNMTLVAPEYAVLTATGKRALEDVVNKFISGASYIYFRVSGVVLINRLSVQKQAWVAFPRARAARRSARRSNTRARS